jgi:ubiquitin-like 1-activating enzyme E1 B
LLKERLGYDEFAIAADAGILYDPDLDDNLQKSLSELGITASGNVFITVTDDADEPKVDLILSTRQQSAPEDGSEAAALHLVPTNIELPLKPPKDEAEAANGETNGEVAPEPLPDPSTAGQKRKREAEDDLEKSAKKRRSDVYIVEDDDAIFLDD